MSSISEAVASDLFAALYIHFTSQDASNKLTQIEDLYEKAQTDQSLKPQLQRTWAAFYKRMISNIRTDAFIPHIFELRTLTQTIQTVFQKISAKSVIPSDPAKSYFNDVQRFRDELSFLKQGITRKQFTDEFVTRSAQFKEDFLEKYKAGFSNARIDPQAKAQMIETLEASITEFVDEIQRIAQETVIPKELRRLNCLIMEEEEDPRDALDESVMIEEEEELQEEEPPAPPKRGGAVADEEEYEEEDEMEILRKMNIDLDLDFVKEPGEMESVNTPRERVSKDEFYKQLWDVANEVHILASHADGTLRSSLESQASILDALVERDIEGEWFEQRKKMQSELTRSREMLQLLNKAQSMRTNLAIDSLRTLTQEQLIAIIQGFITNHDVRVPIELTVLKGAPIEFKELSRKYKETSDYCEKAENEVKRMNAALIELKSENQRLKCQAAAMSQSVEYHNELDTINERISEIKRLLKGQPQDPDSLDQEMEDLRAHKHEIEEKLMSMDEHDLHMQIEILKSETRELQDTIQKHIAENEELASRIKEISAELVRKTTIHTDIGKPVIRPMSERQMQRAAPSSPVPSMRAQRQNHDEGVSSPRPRQRDRSPKRFANLTSQYAQKTLRRKSGSPRASSPRPMTPPPVVVTRERPPFRMR